MRKPAVHFAKNTGFAGETGVSPAKNEVKKSEKKKKRKKNLRVLKFSFPY